MDFLPWGNREVLNDDEFYNRVSELDNMKNLLSSTANGNAPDILLTGIRGVGKTVFLKKLKKELSDDYLVIYLDISKSGAYQKNNMSVGELMGFFYNEIISEAKRKNLNTLEKKVEKFFKTNNFSLKDISNAGGYPVPVPGFGSNQDKLLDFVLDLSEDLYNENNEKIKGVIFFIDEFQLIKELGDYMESFLWKFRSHIQKQNHIAYVFSGSMGLNDKLISEIASQGGVFGGRMLTFTLFPFSKETVKNYLDLKAHNLIFTDEGFERFYKCTSGVPAQVNILARILPKDLELDAEIVMDEFYNALYSINSYLISIWNGLSYKEQYIIVSLLDGPLKRADIAREMEISSGSLSNSLNNLLNKSLIAYDENKYTISEHLLKVWLKREYATKGIYPFRLA